MTISRSIHVAASLFNFFLMFIWLLQGLVVACGVFCLHCDMQDPYLPDQESNPEPSATGPPGRSLLNLLMPVVSRWISSPTNRSQPPSGRLGAGGTAQAQETAGWWLSLAWGFREAKWGCSKR